MVKIVVVTGSMRPNSAGQQVVPYVVQKLQEKDAVVSVADLSKLALPFFDSALPPSMEGFSPEHQSVLQWTTMVKEADGVVLVSPEYNHSLSGVQKNAIDWIYKEWEGKPVAFVGYGFYAAKHAYQHLELMNEVLHMKLIEPIAGLQFMQDLAVDGAVQDDEAVSKKIDATVSALIAAC